MLVMLFWIGLSGCGSDEPRVNTDPELSPVCPDWFYWIDAIKSCEMLEDDMSEE